MEETNVSFDERLHASMVQFLMNENEKHAAVALLECTIELQWVGNDRLFDTTNYDMYLSGPQHVYEVIRDKQHPITASIKNALDIVLPVDCRVDRLIAKLKLLDVAPDWKAHMLGITLGREIHNQGISLNNHPPVIWQNLRFRSETEKRIAGALDRAGVLFLPNCLARLTTAEGRKNKEPDFVICHQGRWGILEVDGEPYHPPSRTVDDHKRDRDFRAYGIKVVEHYDARECYQQPDRVVKQFLELLGK